MRKMVNWIEPFAALAVIELALESCARNPDLSPRLLSEDVLQRLVSRGKVPAKGELDEALRSLAARRTHPIWISAMGAGEEAQDAHGALGIAAIEMDILRRYAARCWE